MIALYLDQRSGSARGISGLKVSSKFRTTIAYFMIKNGAFLFNLNFLSYFTCVVNGFELHISSKGIIFMYARICPHKVRSHSKQSTHNWAAKTEFGGKGGGERN